MGSNFLIVVVAEEEDTMQYNFCSKNHPLVDALLVFEENPREIHISSRMNGLAKGRRTYKKVLKLYLVSNWVV